ncbi:hypothetical protein GZH53_10635 [Flavihumibacter sp. R14]|nr:hypothetical protein [Flavihumibacter soli]
MPKKISFDFVLDHLTSQDLKVKPMFGMFAIYVGEKIMFILRQRNEHPESNGIWLAVSNEHPEELRNDFPSLTSIPDLPHRHRPKSSEWLLLHEAAADFESLAITLCRLVVKGDRRIGHIPQLRRSKCSVLLT